MFFMSADYIRMDYGLLYDGSKHNESRTGCNSCNGLTVREKDFNLHFCTRNRNYIQSIESDCRNKEESLSFAHSYLDA